MRAGVRPSVSTVRRIPPRTPHAPRRTGRASALARQHFVGADATVMVSIRLTSASPNVNYGVSALTGQGVYPRPLQPLLPIWLGVGGTPESFARAGMLGLPLMVAIIGGDTHRFRPVVDLYRAEGRRAGHPPEQLRVGLHSPGYVADTTQEAIDDYYPGYARTMTLLGKERGWPPVTQAQFDALRGLRGALLLGSPDDVAAKIRRHSEALGGVSRVTFQMDNADLPHAKLLRSIELLGTRVAPLLAERRA